MEFRLIRSIWHYTRPKASLLKGSTIRFSSSDVAPFNSYLVTPKELSVALSEGTQDNKSRIIPMCASWFLPNDPQGRTGIQVFEQKRIPNAVFFDIDAVKDDTSPYPHMLPTAEVFASAMSDLGLQKTDRVVVYDSAELGIFSAPRAAWTLKVFGHPNVHILNNFKIWVENGYATESGKIKEVKEKTKYPVSSINADRVVCFRNVKSAAKDYGKEGEDQYQILDARSPGRFSGKDPEPRPGLSSGHIPGSINLPLQAILDPATKAFLPAKELRKVFENAGLNPDVPIISSCGTGVMACALDAALAEANFGEEVKRRVYDGSWTEYAQRIKDDRMIVKDV